MTMVLESVGYQWARPAEKQTLHFRTSRTNHCRGVLNNQYQKAKKKKGTKNSHAETKRDTNWLFGSTGNSTKPDKWTTSPKPFLYFSIALQQMHKVISCKAQTNEPVNSLIIYYLRKRLCLLKKKHWRKKFCLVNRCQNNLMKSCLWEKSMPHVLETKRCASEFYDTEKGF